MRHRDDTLLRLRLLQGTATKQESEVLAFVINKAAAEIERLRHDLDGARLAYRGAGYDRDRMRAERDEARREVCNLSIHLPRDYALERGWDCFKEDR